MKTTLEQYRALAREYTLIPVVKELLADTETPVSVLMKFVEQERVFLLESVEAGENWGPYSFIGVRPEPCFEIDHADADPGRVAERFAGIRRFTTGVKAAPVEGLPRFIGGLVGFLGYEASREFERLPAAKSVGRTRTISRFLRADRLIVFDNLRHTVKLIVCSRPAEHASADLAYEEAMGEIEGMEDVMRRTAVTSAAAGHARVEFSSNLEPGAYEAMVLKAREYITAGDVIQVVLSHRFSARSKVPPAQVYRAMRLLSPSPYMYFLKMGDRTIVGSSPEVMVRLTGDRVELRPIAGTRPRGADEQQDRKLADDLLSDSKEKAEHVMLVDLGRNDLGRVAETGSVQVRDYMTIERYSHVMHIVSHIEAVLKKGCDAVDVICATFPAGTLSGAPKVRAIEIIRELESGPRGIYGGAVGYFGYDGNMDFAITIRTMEVVDSVISIQVGAGIVYNSDPRKEYEETCHKALGMQKAVELAARGLDLG